MAATLALDTQLLQGDERCALPLKKLLHLRAAFEAPLLEVFGFPFILRHQLSAAACCSCCSLCCCCVTNPSAAGAPYLESQHASVSTAAEGAAAECSAAPTAGAGIRAPSMSPDIQCSRAAAADMCTGLRSYASHSTVTADACGGETLSSYYASQPCSAGNCCCCCRGAAAVAAATVPRRLTRTHSAAAEGSDSSSSIGGGVSGSRNSNSLSTRSSNSGSRETGETGAERRRSRKRLRLLGENVAAVVAAAVWRHKNSRSSRRLDERAVEILLGRNVLRQVKLPIDTGSYVLFFTADWLRCLQRCIRAAQQKALLLLQQWYRCASCRSACADLDPPLSRSHASCSDTCSCGKSNRRSTRVSDTATLDSDSVTVVCCTCGKVMKGAECYDILGNTAFVAGDPDSDRYVEEGHKNITAPLRFTPVLRQDDVYVEGQGKGTSDLPICSYSRKQVLLALPARLGQQLKDVLLVQLLTVHTQTHFDKHCVEGVLRGYLLAWHQRRRETVHLLKELLRSADELLEALDEQEILGYESATRRQEVPNSQSTISSGEYRNTDTIKNGLTVTVPSLATIGERWGNTAVKHNNPLSLSSDTGISGGLTPKPNRNLGKQVEIQNATPHKQEARGSRVRVKREEPGTPEGSRLRGSVSHESDHTENKEILAYVPDALKSVPLNLKTDLAAVEIKQGRAYRHSGTMRGIETELTDDEEPRMLEEQHSESDMNGRSVLLKPLLRVLTLLRRGCEAAGEVLSLKENFAARAALGTDKHNAERQRREMETDRREAWRSDETRTNRWKREPQTKNSKGVLITKKEVKLEIEKDEDKGRRWPLIEKNVQNSASCSVPLDSQGKGQLRLFSIRGAAACLGEEKRRATEILQLLTTNEKISLSLITPRISVPINPQPQRASLPDCYRGATSAEVFAAAAVETPATFFATDGRRADAMTVTTAGEGGSKTVPLHLTRKKHRRSVSFLGPQQLSAEARCANFSEQQQRDRAPGGKGEKRNIKEEGDTRDQMTFELILQRTIEELLFLLYEVPLLYNRAGSNAVSLAVPQQGLLVRWLRDGRKEVRSLLKRRRYGEVLWVDVERRGLHRSGLGSRMTLLDLKGVKEVNTTETAAGIVVRLADGTDD